MVLDPRDPLSDERAILRTKLCFEEGEATRRRPGWLEEAANAVVLQDELVEVPRASHWQHTLPDGTCFTRLAWTPALALGNESEFTNGGYIFLDDGGNSVSFGWLQGSKNLFEAKIDCMTGERHRAQREATEVQSHSPALATIGNP